MVARALRLMAIDPAPSLVEALGNMNADHQLQEAPVHHVGLGNTSNSRVLHSASTLAKDWWIKEW
jgi:hypothetical protein